MTALRAAAAAVAIAAAAGAIAASARAIREYGLYRALRPADPSGAELYLDGVRIWGAAAAGLLVAAAVGFSAARRASSGG